MATLGPSAERKEPSACMGRGCGGESGEKSHRLEICPSAAKAAFVLDPVTARLKPRPFKADARGTAARTNAGILRLSLNDKGEGGATYW
ncbi:MAG TPA: hypothetical protein VG714_09995 [Acidobacteriaceae bacterium]|nr:hypothetical protein [Acidobacteriaceae bacterium]